MHLIFGAAGILKALTRSQARNFLLYGGVIYLVLWLYELLVGQDTPRTSSLSTTPTTGCTSSSASP
ncbi:hypothetical protein QF036_004923 [Arthrobacter globiformis]|nr:hypothetical protein [Arthrobacter globiformis]